MAWSASQIVTYLECKRKWWLGTIGHMTRPDTRAALLGTEVHRQLEMYLQNGEPLLFSHEDPFISEAAEIANSGLQWLPPPQTPGCTYEHEFLLNSPRSGYYYGLIDLRDSANLRVYDHKTTSNLKYIKTPEDLLYDPQAMIYAATSMLEWDVPRVTLQWTYMLTRGARRSLPVVQEVTEEHVGTVFAEIENVAQEMASDSTKDWKELEPNVRTCEKYGGCPFTHMCQIGPRERLKAIMSSASSVDTLLARLKANQAAAATLPAPGQVNPPESMSLPPEPATTEVPAADPEPDPHTDPVDQAPAAPPAEKRKYTRKPKDAAPAPVEAPATRIGTLYLNAVPITGAWTPVEKLVEAAQNVVRATEFKDANGAPYRVSDYRLLPYGSGAPIFCAAVEQVLGDWGHVPELVVASTTLPEVSTILVTIVNNAGRLVQGTR